MRLCFALLTICSNNIILPGDLPDYYPPITSPQNLVEDFLLACTNSCPINEQESETLKKETIAQESFSQIETSLMKSIRIPQKSILHIIGDLHGDTSPVEALLKDLISEKKYTPESWKLHPDIYIALLGDYIDRGPCSLKVLTLLTLLLKNNPQQIILLRGNHETKPMINQKYKKSLYKEIKKNTKNKILTKIIIEKFLIAFAHLPLVTFITWKDIDEKDKPNRIALSHGGINPFISQKNALLIQKKIETKKTTAWILNEENPNAYLWSDFVYTDEIAPARMNKERGNVGYRLHQNNIEQWLLKTGAKVLFRGHQQENDLFEYRYKSKLPFFIFTHGKWFGIASFWDDQAHTVNLAPNTGYYGQDDDFICNIGTIARLYQKSETLTQNKNSYIAKTLDALPNIILDPIYFNPKNLSILYFEE